MKLGLYCLEVHSAKASKSQVLGALRERMQARRPSLNTHDIERAKQSLQEARQRLTEYAVLMNSSAGRTGLTVHDVLWGDFYRSVKPDTVPAGALSFRYENALKMDRYKLAEHIGAGKALDDLCESLGQAADPGRQIWRGIRNANLSRFDKPRALDAVQKWAAALSRLETLIAELGAATGWHSIKTIVDAQLVCVQLMAVPEPRGNIEEALLPLALDDVSSASLARWATKAIEVHELDRELEKLCSRSALEARLADLDAIQAQAVKFAVAERPIRTMPEFRDQTTEAVKTSAAHASHLDKILAVTRAAAPSEWTARKEAMLIGFVRLSKGLPEKLLRYRNASLIEGSAIDDLEAARQIAERVNAAAIRAKLEPGTAVAITPAQLRAAAAIFISTGFFGRLFSSEWRNAKTVWRSLFPVEKKIAPEIASQRLTAAAEWKEANTALDASFVAMEMAGRHWSGSSTPFETLITVARWLKPCVTPHL